MKELIKQLTERQQREFAIWCARRCKTEVKEIGLYIDAIEGYYLLGTHVKAEMAAYRASYRAAYRAADWVAEMAAFRAAYRASYRTAFRAVEMAAEIAANRAANREKEVKAQKAKIKRMLNTTAK